MDYENKLVLAPMVRITTLAFRLLALEYGAQIVYSEEIIDYKMVNAKRIVNDELKTIDYCVDGVLKPAFQTCEKERGKVVFQLGTNNPTRALQVCKLVQDDVAAIDINMGCPKEFSVRGGMGAALLKKPDLVESILKTLVDGLSKPVTCKIRCLKSIDETIDLCKRIEKCGVKAIAVHGRFKDERSRNPNHNDFIKEIAKHLTIPVIANGGSNEIKSYEDLEKFRIESGASSVMVARAAMWNPSIFRKEGLIDIDTVINRFLEICLETDNYFFNTKYSIQQMLHDQLQTERGSQLLSTLDTEEIYKLFGKEEEFKRSVSKWRSTNANTNNNETIDNSSSLKRKSQDDDEAAETGNKGDKEEEDNKKSRSDIIVTESGKRVICMHAKYFKKDFKKGHLTPKSILHTYTLENDLPRPVYTTDEKLPERTFRSCVQVNNISYTTPYWETNKQNTEQAAAMVCLEKLGIDYKSIANQ